MVSYTPRLALDRLGVLVGGRSVSSRRGHVSSDPTDLRLRGDLFAFPSKHSEGRKWFRDTNLVVNIVFQCFPGGMSVLVQYWCDGW